MYNGSLDGIEMIALGNRYLISTSISLTLRGGGYCPLGVCNVSSKGAGEESPSRGVCFLGGCR